MPRLANDLMNGNLLIDDYHFAYRWSILGLTALSYTVFGITDLASALPAMLISIIALCLVHTPKRGLDKLSEAVLRVYVWNRGGDRVFVDDFEIEVFQQ